jgi:hypothetical protein
MLSYAMPLLMMPFARARARVCVCVCVCELRSEV